ncbi:MAG: hypothetical protein ACK566_01795, partial [Bacteroidota bacterium]
DVGNKTISVVAQDIYNNTSTKNINVLVLDTVRPRARAQNRTAYLNQSGWVKITGAFLDNGSSDNCSFTLTAIPDSFTCANVGLNTVTLRALDSSGNFTTATCTVTILDTIAPVAQTRNPTVYLDQFGSYTLSPSVVDSSSRDNCNITTYSVTPNAFSCSEVGPNTVTLTLTDPSSNVSSKTATVLVRDTIRPFMFAQDLTVYLDTTNKAVITPFQVDMGSYDNCSIDSMWVLPDTVDCSDLGTQTATLFARDIFNNIASVTYNLTVIDSFPPHTQARQNVLLYLDSNGLHTINPIAIDSGSTDNCGIDSFSVDPAVLDCSHLGLQRAVLTSFDFSGTNSQDSFSYTLVDTILPRIRTTDITVFLNAQGYVTVDATQVDNGSYDNCGIDWLRLSIDSFDCSHRGDNVVWLRGSDIAGNIDSTYLIVTVLDTIAPVVIPKQNLTFYLDANGFVQIGVSDVDSTSSDNCGIDSIWVTPDLVDCSQSGVNTILLYAMDEIGNTGTASVNVLVIDTIRPQVRARNLTVFLDQSGTASINTIDADSNTTDNCGVPSLALSIDQFSCSETGSNTVYLIAVDAAGNIDSVAFNVDVLDTIIPVLNLRNIIGYLDVNGNINLDSAQLDSASYDNCGIIQFTLNPATLTCANKGDNQVEITAQDPSLNTTIGYANVHVIDTIIPIVITSNATVYLNQSGEAELTVTDVYNLSIDNCGIDSMWVLPNSFNCQSVGLQTVFLYVADSSGNVGIEAALVDVRDTIAPHTLARNAVYYLDASGFVTLSAPDLDSGSTDNCNIASLTVTPDILNCTHLGTSAVELAVYDSSNNIGRATSLITVLDTISPVTTTQDITVYLDAFGMATILPGDVNNGSTDNCGIDSMFVYPSTFNCSHIGSNTVMLTTYDESGNFSSNFANVSIVDTVSPVVDANNISVYVDANGTVSITSSDVNNTTTDNCNLDSMWVFPNSFGCTELGSNTVHLFAKDSSGNIGQIAATVDVLDTIAPVTVTRNITVYLNASGTYMILPAELDSGSTDNCAVDSMAVVPKTFGCSNLGVNTVILKTFDASGNFSSNTALVTVLDTVSPIVIARNRTVYLNASGTINVNAAQVNNGSADNCRIDSMWVLPATFGCAELGSNTVVLYAKDSTGNVNTATATVTVLDTVRPITLTRTVSAYVNALGVASITAEQVNNGSTDNCAIDSMRVFPNTFTCSTLGSNTVVLTTFDSSGNFSSAPASVTVIDTLKPNTVTRNITVYVNASGTVSITPTQVNNGSTDNCAIDSMRVVPNTFTCSNLGANTVTLTTYDRSGNFSSNTALVTVVDTVRPVVVTRNVNVHLNALGTASITAAQVNNSSADNCQIDSMWVLPATFGCSQSGNNTVVLYARDSTGNIGQSTATVTVLDTVKPNTITRNITVYVNASGTVSITPTQVNNGSTDNCAIDSMRVVPSTFNCTNLGNNTITLTTFDRSGNFSSAPATVTVLDTLKPNTVTRNITVYVNALGTVNITPTQVNNGSTDNCAIDSMRVVPNTFTCSNLGANSVTLTTLDRSGNFSSAAATVTVLDTVRPITLTRTVSAYVNALGVASITAEQVNNGSTDNCAIDSMRVLPNTFTCSTLGSNTVVLTTFDSSGNFSSAPASVTVIDTLKPNT